MTRSGAMSIGASLIFSARGRAEIAEEEALTDDEMRRISSAVQGLNG
jgi:hypothetical protein